MIHNTAILLFTRQAEVESICKPLSGIKAVDTKVWKYRIQRAIATLKSIQLPYTIHLDQTISDKNFGDKLYEAFQSVFDKGYDAVICIGNDAVDITRSDLAQANEILLAKKGVTTIPAADGGVHLLGIHKNCFDKSFFEIIRWQTQHVQQDIFANCHNVLVITSNHIKELDTIDDVKGFIHLLPAFLIKYLIDSYIIELHKFYTENRVDKVFNFILLQRGPPFRLTFS